VQPRLREDTEKARETPRSAAGASRNARPWLRNIGIAAAAGVFLALVGAMGTDEMPVVQRLIYWVPLMIGGTLVAYAVGIVTTRAPLARTHPLLFGAAQAVLVSLPITGVVWVYNGLLGAPIELDALPYLFGTVFVISAAMTAIIMLATPGAVTHAPPAGAPAAPVRFLERLSPKLKGAVLYAVSAEDHYLRLHTSKGSDLILMRLADAISELEGLEGAQTHRSWWVAKDAVENARRESDRVTLTLKGGAEAPVSRPNIKPLREAGWF
jgi:hypothetical protein